MREIVTKIVKNKQIAPNVYELVLKGDVKDCNRPGTFVHVQIDGYYLRRPISICNIKGNELTLLYKILGHGTDKLSRTKGSLNILTNLGTGYNLKNAKKHTLLIGGGIGIPPLYLLAKELIKKGIEVTIIMAFNTKKEMFYVNEFKKLGANVIVTTIDGSYGIKGVCTDAMKNLKYDYLYTCGPMPMLKAIYNFTKGMGEYSLEERMGCGTGTCMGCTLETRSGPKQICKHGPVFPGKELL
ncbi:MAG: dihydroorotate dehydrogenase electron transfer subunit [Mycoplasmoidaceae bacterium]|nr:dihydroorotate dehydrogenase electron transfer subunit [Mycoplasmoidaceae bacterium]